MRRDIPCSVSFSEDWNGPPGEMTTTTNVVSARMPVTISLLFRYHARNMVAAIESVIMITKRMVPISGDGLLPDIMRECVSRIEKNVAQTRAKLKSSRLLFFL